MIGILIFNRLQDAIRAGYVIESPIPDSEGFLHARIRMQGGWAKGARSDRSVKK
jgi:hypothetical protein